MPALSPTMTQGNIAEWLKKEGDEVSAGDILADVETDKATMGFDSQEDGYLAKILVPGGTKDVSVGTLLAILVEEQKDVAAFASYAPGATPAAASAAPAAPEASAAAAPVGASSDKIGPAVRRLLHESGLQPSQITGTGLKGMLTKGDVLAAIAGGVAPVKAPVPSPAAPPAAAPAAAPAKAAVPSGGRPKKEAYTDEAVTQMRTIIAARLLESKTTTPHQYFAAEVCLDPVMEMRKALKELGVGVSVNDCVIKAAALALAEVPEANSYYNAAQGEVLPNDAVDVSVAVSTEKGLFTPIVKGANTKSLHQISADVKDLAGRARENKLKPEEFMGGSFSISNLGMFPVDQFCAIINPPQACIMAVGRGVKKVVLKNGKPTTKLVMTVTLSADTRVFLDGGGVEEDDEIAGVGAKFLAAFTKNIESPTKLMMV